MVRRSSLPSNLVDLSVHSLISTSGRGPFGVLSNIDSFSSLLEVLLGHNNLGSSTSQEEFMQLGINSLTPEAFTNKFEDLDN